MNLDDFEPMTEKELQDKGVKVSPVFIRIDPEKGTHPERRKYVPTTDLGAIPMTMPEIVKIFAGVYQTAVLHDKVDGCLVLNVDEFKYSKLPCALHGFDR